MKSLVFLSLIFAFASIGFAQTKTVTNADLEKYRQQRVAAEKEYRENYAKWGMPSPEELQRMNEQSAKERSELAARIDAENLEREKLAAEYARAQAASQPTVVVVRNGVNRYIPVYYGYQNYRPRRPVQMPWYYAQPLPNLANFQITSNQYPYVRRQIPRRPRH